MTMTQPTAEEFRAYLNDVAKSGIRTKVSILSLGTKRVYYAAFRGSEVQELVEYGSEGQNVQWKEQVDESGRYSWIPSFWRFGNGATPPKRKVKTEGLAGYYKEGDVLDVATMYSILLRRGVDHEGARLHVTAVLVGLYLGLHIVTEPTQEWPALDRPKDWRVSTPEGGRLTNLGGALLIRVWAEGYDPLETEVQRGGMPTEEQSSWEATESNDEDRSAEDLECEEGKRQEVLHCSILALRGLYYRYNGIPKV
jgi:hypothetical protein